MSKEPESKLRSRFVKTHVVSLAKHTGMKVEEARRLLKEAVDAIPAEQLANMRAGQILVIG